MVFGRQPYFEKYVILNKVIIISSFIKAFCFKKRINCCKYHKIHWSMVTLILESSDVFKLRNIIYFIFVLKEIFNKLLIFRKQIQGLCEKVEESKQIILVT